MQCYARNEGPATATQRSLYEPQGCVSCIRDLPPGFQSYAHLCSVGGASDHEEHEREVQGTSTLLHECERFKIILATQWDLPRHLGDEK